MTDPTSNPPAELPQNPPSAAPAVGALAPAAGLSAGESLAGPVIAPSPPPPPPPPPPATFPIAWLLWQFSYGGPIHDMPLAAIGATLAFVVVIGIVIIGLIGYAIELLMRWLERRRIPWRGKG